jgi:GTP-binding protein
MSEIKSGSTASTQPAYTIVLWGSTNVGKSTLFNKLTGTRKAIVANRPGVTVDTHALEFNKDDVGRVRVIDSGGVGSGLRDHQLRHEIEARAMNALKDAQLVLFVVDGTKQDSELEELSKILRKNLPHKAEVVLVLNKVDRKDFSPESFYALGFKNVVAVSAEHGKGVHDIWEIVKEKIPEESKEIESEGNVEPLRIKEEDAQGPLRVLILGRPNVGKSTLMNHLTKSDISAVSNVAGTTRDYISTKAQLDDNLEIILTDTAGLRRPGRRERDVEWVATQKIIDLSRRANVAVLVLDSDEGVTDQDSAIAGFAIDSGMSLIVALNKWDLVKENKEQEYKFQEIERSRDLKMAFLTWCPVVRISAKTGLGVKTLREKIQEVSKARTQRVQTSQLNAVFEKRIKDSSGVGAVGGGGTEKLYYMSQISVNPPEFILFCNMIPNKIHFSFRRYVVNVLREEFGFQGTPIKLHFKQH